MVATLDVELGCLQGPTGAGNEEAEALMTAAQESNSTILGTDNGLQLWRLIDTPLYRRLIRGQDTIYRSGHVLRQSAFTSTSYQMHLTPSYIGYSGI